MWLAYIVSLEAQLCFPSLRFSYWIPLLQGLLHSLSLIVCKRWKDTLLHCFSHNKGKRLSDLSSVPSNSIYLPLTSSTRISGLMAGVVVVAVEGRWQCDSCDVRIGSVKGTTDTTWFSKTAHGEVTIVANEDRKTLGKRLSSSFREWKNREQEDSIGLNWGRSSEDGWQKTITSTVCNVALGPT